MSRLHLSSVHAEEILDSRGMPTLSVTVMRGDGLRTSASVPVGASTGSKEAHDLRDGDPNRYSGAGVTKAVASVNGEIADLLRSRTWEGQEAIDQAMIEADGTRTRDRLGGNALIGVSLAVARLMAEIGERPLWASLRSRRGQPRLPVPHMNILNGGAHARTSLEFQEFMIAAIGAPSLTEGVRAGAEVYHRLRALLAEQKYATGLGDEGGFAPDLRTPEQAIELLQRAIQDAGYAEGLDGLAIAIDPAASQFRDPDGTYRLAGHSHSAAELAARYVEIVRDYPVWSIEDGMAEDDLDGWRLLTEELGERTQIVGDDLLVTNAELIDRAVREELCTAVLIKPNQAGTVTEIRQAIERAQAGGLGQMVSHRSGETPDDFIADLAVGIGCGQIKAGAPARGERVAKYNRLLAIERGEQSMPYGLPAGTIPVRGE
ncbi:phosphopyruvate hydratase [Sciscionella marina]|uniref:phosphopyruvate hydratase n=1 Tax=Sciscionella marina TaxID=508770 RepID=UPI000367F07E|nr:phosphopyruvate hydratase [Sciscionella marina]